MSGREPNSCSEIRTKKFTELCQQLQNFDEAFVFGRQWEIKLDPKIYPKTWGLCDPDLRRLTLTGNNQDVFDLTDTFYHELAHAILMDAGMQKHDEKLIQAFGHGLASFMMDERNQELIVAFLNASTLSLPPKKRRRSEPEPVKELIGFRMPDAKDSHDSDNDTD